MVGPADHRTLREADTQTPETGTSGASEALLRTIRRCPLIMSLRVADLRNVLAMGQERRIMRREAMFRQGDRPEGSYLLMRGMVKLHFRSRGGRSIILDFVGPGEAFGDLALMAGTPQAHTAEAVVESSVLAWKAEVFEHLLRRYPAMMRSALRLTARQIQDNWGRLYALMTEPVARRLARAVLRLAHADRHGMVSVVSMKQRDLAELLGTTPPTLSRILGKWEARGLVAAGRERTIVLDPEGLARLADPDEAAGPLCQDRSQIGLRRQ